VNEQTGYGSFATRPDVWPWLETSFEDHDKNALFWIPPLDAMWSSKNDNDEPAKPFVLVTSYEWDLLVRLYRGEAGPAIAVDVHRVPFFNVQSGESLETVGKLSFIS
jgi:hypothetical protein